MELLLDTHTFLWWITNDRSLSVKARKYIADDENRLFLSTASLWEIAIKTKLNRISLPKNPKEYLLDQLQENAIEVLPILASHALRVATLPTLHKDPFDHMLIAQALEEKHAVITRDSLFGQYGAKVIW